MSNLQWVDVSGRSVVRPNHSPWNQHPQRTWTARPHKGVPHHHITQPNRPSTWSNSAALQLKVALNVSAREGQSHAETQMALVQSLKHIVELDARISQLIAQRNAAFTQVLTDHTTLWFSSLLEPLKQACEQGKPE